MIQPTKYLELDSCVLQVSHVMLSELSRVRALPLRDIENVIEVSAPRAARSNLELALTFLYGVGVIDYDPDSDALFLITAASREVT